MNDSSIQVVVQVPGKVMLAGEYAVLRGGQALATTVARFLQVEATTQRGAYENEPTPLTLTADSLHKDSGASKTSVNGFVVTSDLWQTPYFLPYLVGSHDSAVSTLAHEPLLETVNTGMHLYRVRSGQVNVHSELDQTFGLGSSSALRLGVLLAMRRLSTSCYESSADELQGYYARPNADWSAAINAFKLQKAAQKNASGYDIATQLQGGLVFFTPPLASAEPSWPNGLKNGTTSQQRSLNDLIHIYVGGSGAPTGIVMSDTIAWLDSEARWPMVQDLSVGLVEAFAVALHRGIDDEDALIHLYQAVQKSRQAFTASPHFPHSLAAKLEDVPGCDKSWSFKTTGAGGEDAVLLIGTHEALRAAKELMAAQGWGPLEAAFEQAGTRIQRTVTS